MDLDGARNAKADIFLKIFGFVETPRRSALSGLPHFTLGEEASFRLRADMIARSVSDSEMLGQPISAIRRAGGAPSVEPPPIAIGIGGGETPRSRQILLLCQDRRLRHHPAVEQAVGRAAGEARFVYAGPQRRLSYWSPARRRPACPGLSVAHHRITAGTLGAFVELEEAGIGILSNNHVLADLNRGILDDDILQPGRRDSGMRPADVIGSLLRFVPLREGGVEVNRVDAAIARLSGDMLPSPELPREAQADAPGRITGTADHPALPDEEVFKFGRTTGLTRGRLFATEVDNYIVNLGSASRPFRCRFDDQLQAYSEAGPFASPGDSGALAIDSGGAAHGLLFAGSRTGGPTGFGLAAINPIGPVLEELDTRLWTS